jgi:hypothetical protein
VESGAHAVCGVCSTRGVWRLQHTRCVASAAHAVCGVCSMESGAHVLSVLRYSLCLRYALRACVRSKPSELCALMA